MIILSSFRPFKEDPEWDRNQMLAYRSWMMFAKRVFLFGNHEPELANGKVSFIPSEQFPTIRFMASIAAQQKNQVVAIVNGDIMLDPRVMKIEQRIRNGGMRCASSRRWHFDPLLPMDKALESASLIDADGRDDRGRDTFIARSDVWKKIADEIPERLRIGHGTWDAWLTDAFRRHWDHQFLDFTGLRIAHHPHHGGRRRPHELETLAPI